MATDTELKKLNKTVDEAVNMLKVYMGNSAQAKNMNEKQREAISKWFDVGQQAEETQKKQRAFVERERDEKGKFIKKQEESEENKASKFMNMAKSVGSVFAVAGKGIKTASIGLYQGITKNLTNFFGQMKSHFLGLFGEESEWFGIIGSLYDSVKGFFGWFARGFMLFIRRTPAWANKTVDILSKMYGAQQKQMKMDFQEVKGKKKGGVWGTLATILVAIAAGLGAWLHRKLFLLSRLPIFGKIAKMFSKIDDIPFIGRLFKAVKFGFKWLGWPLTILLSAIDFIRGFSATIGTLWEKVRGGLWGAVEGFIFFLPDTIMAWTHMLFDSMADLNPIAPIIDFIEKFMGTEGTFWQKIKEGFVYALASLQQRIQKWQRPLLEAIQPIIAGVINFFVDFWNQAVSWIASKIPSWMPKKDAILGGLTSVKMERIEPMKKTVQSPLEMASEYEKKIIKDRKKESSDLKDKIEQGTKATEKAANASNAGTLAVTSIARQSGGSGGGGVETQQIPDELDNWIMDVKNYGGDFD